MYKPILSSLALASALAMTSAAHAGLVVDGAWVRALPPTQSMTAAYLTVTNTGVGPVVIVGAATDVSPRVEIHTTRNVDGLSRMERLDSLSVPAGDSVTLRPGAAHLMLLDLTRMPAAGETLRLCLLSAAGERSCFDAPVYRDAPQGDDAMHQHHQVRR